MKAICATGVAMAVLALMASAAWAELCPKCADGMYTMDIGRCVVCGGDTGSGAFALCRQCSEKLGQCEHCRAPLKPAAAPPPPSPVQPPAATQPDAMPAPAVPTPPEPRVLGKSANGTTVSAEVGQKIVIRLEGNPTTGYEWAVTAIKGAAAEPVLAIRYTPEPAGAHRLGSGGVFEMIFRAVAPGSTLVKMAYKRSWEKDVPPLETFAVTIAVAGPAATEPDAPATSQPDAPADSPTPLTMTPLAR